MNLRTALSDMGEIHMSQSERVSSAANQARLRNQTRRTRAYRKTASTIRRQIAIRSLG